MGISKKLERSVDNITKEFERILVPYCDVCVKRFKNKRGVMVHKFKKHSKAEYLC